LNGLLKFLIVLVSVVVGLGVSGPGKRAEQEVGPAAATRGSLPLRQHLPVHCRHPIAGPLNAEAAGRRLGLLGLPLE